jgi:YidC/Oxa1 family membrane protein insertase
VIAAYPWSPLFQALLDGIGSVLAWLYALVGSYGLAIIILTVVIRLILLPLGVKQIKSMQAMQAIQPKVKELQKKYKNNKAKAQEETMKLYRESGVNPLGGCLPLLLQFPILISMYAVLRAPEVVPQTAEGQVAQTQEETAYYDIHNNHLPVDSELFRQSVNHEGTDFLLMNLQCSAAQAGNEVPLNDNQGRPIVGEKPLQVGGDLVGSSRSVLDCGDGLPVKAPYFAMLLFMIGTTFYQQRQMSKASPAGSQSAQQQAILKIMPVMFGIFGFTFPAGLVVYWTTSNLWQIGQQAALLRAGHIGPDALERRRQEIASKPPKQGGGLFSGVMARADQERKRREGTSDAGGAGQRSGGSKGSAGARGTSKGSAKGSAKASPKGSSGSRTSGKGGASRGTGNAKASTKKPPRTGSGSGAQGTSGTSGSSGGASGDGGSGASSKAPGVLPQRPKPKRPGGGTPDGS